MATFTAWTEYVHDYTQVSDYTEPNPLESQLTRGSAYRLNESRGTARPNTHLLCFCSTSYPSNSNAYLWAWLTVQLTGWGYLSSQRCRAVRLADVASVVCFECHHVPQARLLGSSSMSARRCMLRTLSTCHGLIRLPSHVVDAVLQDRFRLLWED